MSILLLHWRICHFLKVVGDNKGKMFQIYVRFALRTYRLPNMGPRITTGMLSWSTFVLEDQFKKILP